MPTPFNAMAMPNKSKSLSMNVLATISNKPEEQKMTIITSAVLSFFFSFTVYFFTRKQKSKWNFFCQLLERTHLFSLLKNLQAKYKGINAKNPILFFATPQATIPNINPMSTAFIVVLDFLFFLALLFLGLLILMTLFASYLYLFTILIFDLMRVQKNDKNANH